jgi:MFS family permease
MKTTDGRSGGPLFVRVFTALSMPDFRRLWAYNALASVGMTVEMLAQGWIVLVLTDSPFWVGVAGGVRAVGQLAFGAVGGVFADRMDRRQLLLIAQSMRSLLFLGIGLLALTGRLELWQVMAVALIQGGLQSTVQSANQALIYDIVGPQRLLNAFSAHYIAMSITRIMGAVVGGSVISGYGVAAGYFAATAAFVSCQLPLLIVRSRSRSPRLKESMWRNLTGGVGYAARTRGVRVLLIFSIFMETFGFSYQILLPVIAKDVLEVGASGLGFLTAAANTGALAGTLGLSALGDFRRKIYLLITVSVLSGVNLVLFSLLTWYSVSLVLAGLVGGTLTMYDVTMATMVQLASNDQMRGRIAGLYNLTFGFTPLGGFVGGIVATIISAPVAIGFGGVVIIGATAALLRRRKLYIETQPVPIPT